MEKMKIQFVQFGHNCWEDCTPSPEVAAAKPNVKHRAFSPRLADYFNKDVFRRLIRQIADCNMNTVVLDLADGIRYQSHPEIALADSFSREEFRDELKFCRDLGLEVLPKLNFSTGHDTWLKEYERMISTSFYYNCCKDLIEEVCELFDGPRLFHLGMDEEDYPNQQYYNFVAIRQGMLWWHDLNFLADEVVKCGMTPWVWSDKVWHTPLEEFTANMSPNIVQSSWYYGKDFGFADDGKANIPGVNAYLELAKAGYKQIPCGSNLHNAENYPETVRFCEKHIPGSTIGYLMAPWRATNEKNEAQLLDGARIAGAAHDLIG